MAKKTFEQRWKETEKKLVPFELEPGIKDVVIGLHLNGASTRMSCEGHVGRGCPFPWVDIVSAPEPLYEWKGQQKFEAATLKALKASRVDIEPGPQRKDDVLETYLGLLWGWAREQGFKRTAAHLAWQVDNERVFWTVYEWILDFEKDRQGKACRVHLDVRGRLTVRDAFSYQDEYASRPNEKMKTALTKRLKERRKTMLAFARFLEVKARAI